MDDFFTKTKCDRCGGSLNNISMMSWFTEDCLCMECIRKEHIIKDTLADPRLFEGCGYIPEVKV